MKIWNLVNLIKKTRTTSNELGLFHHILVEMRVGTPTKKTAMFRLPLEQFCPYNPVGQTHSVDPATFWLKHTSPPLHVLLHRSTAADKNVTVETKSFHYSWIQFHHKARVNR